MNQTASDSERPILNIMRARAKDSREPSEGEQRASRAERADRIRNPRIHRSRGKIDKIERIIQLATNQRVTSRTKYFHVKWHHFWNHVSEDDGKDGKTVLKKVDTVLQDADYFTKPLVREPFESNRFRVQGW